MFFIYRSTPTFPQHASRPDHYQLSPEERYYRQIAEEHNRRADLALRLAQQERQRALREREVRAFRARQYQQDLASQAQSGHPYWNHRRPHVHPFDLIFSFASDEQATRACSMEPNAHRRPRSFFDHFARGMDVPVEHGPSCGPRSVRFARPCPRDCWKNAHPGLKQVRFDAEQATPRPHAPKKDKGKARAPLQESTPTTARQEPPRAENPLNALWDLFGGLAALEEEDAIVRQLNLFGANSYPGLAQHGVAGPSGTRQKPHSYSTSAAAATSASAPSSKPATAVPIKTPSQSTPPSASSSPKSHAVSFTSLDAIQSRFDSLKSSFVFPDSPQFELAGSTSSGIPKLAYSASNALVHDYENELTKLLAKLDAVESDGAESIRGARKALVVAVEKELDRLEEEKKTAWRNSLDLKEFATPALEPHRILNASVHVEAVGTTTEEIGGYDVGEPEEAIVPQASFSQSSKRPESSTVPQPQHEEEILTVMTEQAYPPEHADVAADNDKEHAEPAAIGGSAESNTGVALLEHVETREPLQSHSGAGTERDVRGSEDEYEML